MPSDDILYCRNLDDVEVMIDALDDPNKRWFAARELRWYISCCAIYGLPETTRELRARILLILKLDQMAENPSIHTVLDALRLSLPSSLDVVAELHGRPVFDPNEIQPAWVYKELVFHTKEAAEAYRDYCEAAEAKPPLDRPKDEILISNNLPGLP